MGDWLMIKEAERVSLANKKHNRGFYAHKAQWMQNLVEIQQMVLEHRMQTGEYHYDECVSGQGKMRKIAKLYFHPSHIEHQLLVMASHEELDKSLITHTYASRKGYGQHRGAKQLNRWVQENWREYRWYVQFDIVKYYENIPHSLLRRELERRIKDKEYINCLMEPVEKFSPSGIGIPLGIRPSQTFGNLALSSFDRFVKEKLRCRYYIRYLDDFVILCHTKAEARRKRMRIAEFLKGMGFRIHQPRLDKIENGIDMLGFVIKPRKGMYWRNSDKKHWLRARSRVSNYIRRRELDCAAWGYITHGNRDCKRLYRIMGGIPFGKLGIDTSATDKNGKRIIDAQKIGIDTCLNERVDIVDVVPDVETKFGGGRVALEVIVFGQHRKMIVNAPFKDAIVHAWELGVTGMSVVFVDKGGKHYDIKDAEVTEVDHRKVRMDEDKKCALFCDNNEICNLIK